MKTIVRLITITRSLSVVSPAPAQIAWETRKVEVDAELGQNESFKGFHVLARVLPGATPAAEPVADRSK